MVNKTRIIEGLDYHDLEGQMVPIVSVDEYEAKMGKNRDIVTLSFIVKDDRAGKDLVSWFERGYDFVLDASLSKGEVTTGKWLVFVELKRRIRIPERIVQLLSDLTTLTNLQVNDWTVKVDDEEYDADVDILKQIIICNPHRYEKVKQDEEKDKELNEMRQIAGLEIPKINVLLDDSMQRIKDIAGL